ncbi:MAG: acyl-ACP desaturase [Candidatus Binatus sp.]|uniref:acyl-ACP desaturase n=1 Tax=Candidatus Binatus sp. TaxID=2811406 RepID=UPI00271B9CF8|nr:acyl-ACP desaturase [Candidatus Binatus sp.]MDO8434226.1 acyl-ACP desaturase [Candidatus Binatus sp.]
MIPKEKFYRAYMDFFETAERKRRWNIFEDIPWDKLSPETNTEERAIRIETYCAEEMYLPDYNLAGVEMTRSVFGLAWFQTCWSHEESRHGLAFREYLLRSGMRTEEQFSKFEADTFSRSWKMPFKTLRQMACYGALQETATYLAYKAQKDRAELENDKTLEAIFFFIGRDEAAHAGFYREMLALEIADDRSGTIADLAMVIANFSMPGDGLIPDYQEHLRIGGGGISPRKFFTRAVLPTLKQLGTSRDELKSVTALALGAAS